MAHIVDSLHHTGSIPTTPGLATRIASWFHAWKERSDREYRLLHMLSYSDHLLQDMGLSRKDLTKELGYDPDADLRIAQLSNNYMPRL